MKLVYLKSALKYNSFDVTIGIKISFYRVSVTIEPGRSLLQFVTTNCLINTPNSHKYAKYLKLIYLLKPFVLWNGNRQIKGNANVNIVTII